MDKYVILHFIADDDSGREFMVFLDDASSGDPSDWERSGYTLNSSVVIEVTDGMPSWPIEDVMMKER